MARPKKIILNGDEETETGIEVEDVQIPEPDVTVEQPVTSDDIKVVDVQIPEPNVRVKQPVISNDTEATPPICDIQGLSNDEKRLVISSRIETIIGKTQIPFIPAFVQYKDSDSTSSPPLHAIVDNVDHLYLTEAWEFYKSNAPNPNAVEFLEIVRLATRTPERVFARVVPISLM